MSAILNALIRYKQIDKCLRNRFVDCTIHKMQEVCSEALAEFRGVYKLVSERTIRDDIRVMRSEMLGFEAPIVFEDEKYYYSDPNYSIFDVSMEEKELLKEVFLMLLKEREKLTGPEVGALLKRLSDVTGEEIPHQIPWKLKAPELKGKIPPATEHALYNKSGIHFSEPPDTEKKESPFDKAIRSLASHREDNALYWGYILELL